MEDRYKEQNVEMIYKKMNVTEMTEFQNDEFNVVIDKALMDSMLCGENAIPVVEKMMKEVYRVTAPGGVFIIISNGDEQNRKMFFDESVWEYKMLTIEKTSKMIALDENPKNYHYIYILTKKIVEQKKEEMKEEKKQEETK